MNTEISPLIVSTPVLAALLRVTSRRVQQLHSEGVFPAAGHGNWDALICVPAAHQHRFESEMARAEKTPSAERVRDLKGDEIALRLERESGALVDEARAEALAIVDEFAGSLRSDLMSVPARVTKDLALRRAMEREIEDAFGAASKRAASAGTPDLGGRSPANRAARRAARARSKR